MDFSSWLLGSLFFHLLSGSWLLNFFCIAVWTIELFLMILFYGLLQLFGRFFPYVLFTFLDFFGKVFSHLTHLLLKILNYLKVLFSEDAASYFPDF